MFLESFGLKNLSYAPWTPLIIEKSAPGVDAKGGRPTSVSAMQIHAYSLAHPRYEKLFGALQIVAGYLGSARTVLWIRELADTWTGQTPLPFLGKLGMKEEPGKVRVFAMVDWWTQTVLSPFHHAIIGKLSKLPMDGTMDQDRAVAEGREMLSKRKFGASFDLSAATDRLPVSLQAMLVDAIQPGLGAP